MKKIIVVFLLLITPLVVFGKKQFYKAVSYEKLEYSTNETVNGNCDMLFCIDEEFRSIEFYGESNAVIRYGNYYSTELENGLPVVIADAKGVYNEKMIVLFFTIGVNNFIGIKDKDRLLVLRYVEVYDN